MTYHIGQIVTGKISGIQDYGVFVALDEKTQGLVHISEWRSGIVTDLKSEVNLGEEIKVVILDIDPLTNKISLSVRQTEIATPKAKPKPGEAKGVTKYFWTDQSKHIGFKTIAQTKPQAVKEALNRIGDSEVSPEKIMKKI